MLEQIRRRLLRWLNVPSESREPEVSHHDLKVLMDRMDSLERMVMTKVQRPDEGTGMVPSSSKDELSVLPDAHLGAQ